MPKTTVIWQSDVEDDFIDQWIRSTSEQRQRLAQIANSIDRELANDPDLKGEPLPSEPGVRLWTLPGLSPPVGVVFQVFPDDRLVHVLRIMIAGGAT